MIDSCYPGSLALPAGNNGWRKMRIRLMLMSSVIVMVLGNIGPGPDVARAEWYASGFGGIVAPGSLSNVEVTGGLSRFGATAPARISDIDLENGFTFGVKAGYFSEKRKWVGVETELFTFTPNLAVHPLIVGSPGQPAFGTQFTGAPVRVTALALNVITREPSMEHFSPYGGVGPALFYSSSSAFPGRLRVTPGLNVIAGARYYVTERAAVFGEFRFNTVTIKLGGFSGDYSGQMFISGISYHFGSPKESQP